MAWEDPWDSPVRAMLEDLELQAEGLDLVERAVEVSELSAAQYAEVDVLGRLHSSTGRVLQVELAEGLVVRGVLGQVGAGWFRLDESRDVSWCITAPAVLALRGLTTASVPSDARPLGGRLSLRSALRRIVEARGSCALHVRGGRIVLGQLSRVGADFVDLLVGEERTGTCVPLAAIVAVRSSPW